MSSADKPTVVEKDTSHSLLLDVSRRTEDMQKKIAGVQSDLTNLNTRVSNVENQVSNVSTHLATLVVETKNTNTLLERSMDQRQQAEAHRMAMEVEEREWRRSVDAARLQQEQTDRGIYRSILTELWHTFRQPLATLLLAIASFAAYYVATQQGN